MCPPFFFLRAQIEVRANDDIQAVAAQFCKKHSLDPPVKRALGSCLAKHMSQLHTQSDGLSPKPPPAPRADASPVGSAQVTQTSPARRRARRRRGSARVFDRLYQTAQRLRAAREVECACVCEREREREESKSIGNYSWSSWPFFFFVRISFPSGRKSSACKRSKPTQSWQKQQTHPCSPGCRRS